MENILIVDDDAELRELLQTYLERNGYRTTTAADGRGMWAALDRHQVDLIVLDLMLPGDDGLTLCRNLRAHTTLSSTPVIMLTARGEDMDRILGLEMGADDYVPKPFNPRELLARIKSVLRRTQGVPLSSEATQTKFYVFNEWGLDVVGRQLVSPQRVIIALTDGEFRLLRVFLEHPNRVLSRDQLLDLTRGRETIPFDRSIDVQVGRVRKRLNDTGPEPSIIKTVRGEGYVLSTKVERKTELPKS
ncbi:MAG: response regulator [Gammaproteobacteria bacterium]|nr:response regulator [Gammaproteobacteria bacterium]MDH5802231.1 response regulator [Gammaproteobacteria bacterium]